MASSVFPLLSRAAARAGAPVPVAPAFGASAQARPLALAGIVALHALLLWTLLQSHGVQQMLLQTQPLVVMLLADRPAAPAAAQHPPAPAPAAPAGLPRHLPPANDPPVLPTPATTAPVDTPPGLAAATAPDAAVPRPLQAPAPSAQPPATPAQPAAEAPQRVLPGSAIQFTEPPVVVYPRLSRRNGEIGRVIVRAFVDAAGGAPRSVQLAQSSGYPRLDDAALAAVLKARFKPTIEGGQAIAGWALVPIDFELEAAR